MSKRHTTLIGFDATPLEVTRRSGISHYVAHLLDALVERADPWRYALLSGRRLVGAIPAATRRIGARFPNRWLWMQFVLPATLARLRPDVCHFTNSVAPILIDRPYVLSLYDVSLFLHPHTQPLKSRLLIRTLIPSSVRRAAAVLTLTESSRRDIVRVLGADEAKVHVVGGAAGSRYQPIAHPDALGRVRERYRLPDAFILYVGTVEPRKNLVRLLRAFREARAQGRAEHLVIAGQLGWKYRALLEQRDRDGLRGVVHLLGYVPDDDLPALYALARLFAFPSHYEGFGLPIVESMACGTPVLTADRPATAEVAGGAAVLVDPMDEAAMTIALVRVLESDALRAELRRKGLVRAAEFSWPRVAAETAAVYARVLGERKMNQF